MKVIDANALLDKAISTENYLAIKSLVESLPILNEPCCNLLSLNELESMDGEPIWIETNSIRCWVIIESHDSKHVIGGGIYVITQNRERWVLEYDKCFVKWVAYRMSSKNFIGVDTEKKKCFISQEEDIGTKNKWVDAQIRLPNEEEFNNLTGRKFLCRVLVPEKGGKASAKFVVLEYDSYSKCWICDNMLVTHWSIINFPD